MPRSIKLHGNPDWFEFLQVENRSDRHSRNPANSNVPTKSVDLGKKLVESENAAVLPSKLGLTKLLKFDDCTIAKHILSTNTFFHGRIGFFEIVMQKIFAAVGEKNPKIEYLYTSQNLPKQNKPDRLILLPNVRSEEIVNDLLAQSLRHKSKAPVWLVANPSSIHKHLLLSFHNFFIATNNSDDIKHLQNILSLPKVTMDLLLSNEREAVFITDFDSVVNKSNHTIAVVRLESFE